MNSLFFCQNDSLMRESHWQKDSLVTYILFDICLFKHFSMSQIFVISLYFLKIILTLFLQTFWTICTVVYTVACIIVRRLLISLHKWQFPGMADTQEYWSQHDVHLVHLPIFHGLNLIIFS